MVDPHPVGFRFRPTDEEIFNPYLKSKNMDGNTSHVDEVISTVDIYSFDPSELACKFYRLLHTVVSKHRLVSDIINAF